MELSIYTTQSQGDNCGAYKGIADIRHGEDIENSVKGYHNLNPLRRKVTTVTKVSTTIMNAAQA